MPKTKKRSIIAEDLYRINLITGFEISPDGKQVVYSERRIEKKTEKKFSNLRIVSTKGGAIKEFTHGDHSDSLPKWSPDGKSIAFLSNRKDGKESHIYAIPVDGGEARQLTDLKGEIHDFSWSPDVKKLVLQFRKKDKEEIERDKDERKKKLGVVARHYTRPFFKSDGYGYLPKERVHIFTVDSKTGKAKQLTDGDEFDEYFPTWSPDGKHILFESIRTKEPDLHIYDAEFYLIPSGGGKIRKIETIHGNKFHPSFSPDGKTIAFLGVEGENDWGKNIRLWTATVDGKGKARCLTADYDFDCENVTINDIIGAVETDKPVWSVDGKSIYFQVSHHGNTILKKFNLDNRSNEIEDVISKDGVVGSFGFDKSQEHLAWYHCDSVNIGQIYVRDMRKGAERKLTKVNENFAGQINLGQLEEFWFKGASGNDLQGWILKPPKFNPKKKYPSILEIHGGPWTQYGNMFMHEFYYLAANGYVVCFCNPRGGQGYGEKHARAIDNNWGGPDYDDLMVFTDLIAKKSYIDKNRMGVTGGSYGGYMTNWIIGHTNRFKAAVTQRSVSNTISMWGSSDFNWTFQLPFGSKPPWENVENFWRQSPMAHIGNAKTPTLVIHSESDLRCAIEQGEQIFVALKKLGVDSEMVRFPDEPHGLSRGGRTDRRIERLRHILRWFDKYLK